MTDATLTGVRPEVRRIYEGAKAVRAAAHLRQRRRIEFVDRYHDDFPAFLRDCIRWDRANPGPTQYQWDAARALMQNPRLCLYGPHGLGKTAWNSWLMSWFITTREAAEDDWKLPTTAGAWRQLTHFLWPELRNKWARRIRWDVVGRDPWSERTEIFKLTFRGQYGEAFAVASTQKELIEGAHADQLLYIYDEGKAIAADIYDASEGAFSGAGAAATAAGLVDLTGGDERRGPPRAASWGYDEPPSEMPHVAARGAFAAVTSTPGEPNGRMYDIASHGQLIARMDDAGRAELRERPGDLGLAYQDWWVRHVTLQETIDAGRNSAAWAEQRARQWGRTSPVYVNRVLGEFAADSAGGVIPMAWVERAMDRWRPDGTIKDPANPEAADNFIPHGPLTALGVDVGGGGDRTTLAARHSWWFAPLQTADEPDPVQVAERHVLPLLLGKDAPAVVDVIGIGAGVVGRLRQLVRRVIPFHAAEKAPDKSDRASGELAFLNRRAHAWWRLRELLDPDSGIPVALPPDDQLFGDLVAPKWSVNQSDRVQIESKDDLRRADRLGRSTDRGDAVVMAAYAEEADRADLGSIAPIVVPRAGGVSPWLTLRGGRHAGAPIPPSLRRGASERRAHRDW